MEIIRTTLGNNHIFYYQFFENVSNDQLDGMIEYFGESIDDEDTLLYADKYGNTYIQDICVDEFYQILIQYQDMRYGDGIK